MKNALYSTKQLTRVPNAAASTSFLALAIVLATSPIVHGRAVLVNTGTVSQTGILVGDGGGGGSTASSTESDDAFSLPRSPSQPVTVSRSTSAITLKWIDNSSYEQGYRLYRGEAFSGPWTQIASWGAKTGNSGVMQFTDSGLPRDKGFYYRIGAYNSYGEAYSRPQSHSTIDGRKFSQLQLRLRTATTSDADTENAINVSISAVDFGGTWLDYGRDDFERGDEFTYELLPKGKFSDLSGINNISILKPGTDGWCVESVALLADGVEIFSKHLATGNSTCKWLDSGTGNTNQLFIGRDAIRAHPAWQAYQQPIPFPRLIRTDLESRIEGMVGDLIHYGVPVDAFPLYQGTLGVSWTDYALDGDSHVAVTKKDSSAVHVHFELDVNTPGPGGLTGGIDFDLRFTGLCRTENTPAKIEMKTENISAAADFDWTTEALSLWLANLLEDKIANKIKNAFPNLSQIITIDNKIVSCVTPVTEDDGTVDFDLAFVHQVGTGTHTGTTTGTILTAGTITKSTNTILSKGIFASMPLR